MDVSADELRTRYRIASDQELRALLSDAADLTDVARALLQAEASYRGLETATPSEPDVAARNPGSGLGPLSLVTGTASGAGLIGGLNGALVGNGDLGGVAGFAGGILGAAIGCFIGLAVGSAV